MGYALCQERIKATFGAETQAQVLNLMENRELSRRLEGTSVTTYALHPGVVFTDIWRNMPQVLKYLFYFPALLLMKNCRDGAQVGREIINR